MLPPKIGDGVFGSNSGGVKPTGASSFVGASVLPSAAAALMAVRSGMAVDLSGLGAVKEMREDCFHGDFGLERVVGVKREAWVAMAMVEFG